MSYTQLITFYGGLPHGAVEYRNAWGGASRIWDSLWDRYCKRSEYDSWISTDQQQRLWDLHKWQEIPSSMRAVLLFTFDLWYVKATDFQRFATDLRNFASFYHRPGYVDHLPAWADHFSISDAEAIGLYGTSVGDNLWKLGDGYDPEVGEPVLVPLAKGKDVYAWLDAQPELSCTGKPLPPWVAKEGE